ncbi:unnamed protein product [Schistosoma rodhaini]|uniref:Uncharacterized protein n=1 Tax=Schistosoma rodhaini TaxID=6188 RepID=A0AA85ELT7_9TREM|nr:unnamed protein product [Schistosoma rodhaini]
MTYPQVYQCMWATVDTFGWKNVEVFDRGNSKIIREFLEAWSINKHIKIHPIYQPIRKFMDKYRTKNQINETYNQNKENNNRLKANNNQPIPKSARQAVSRMWRNSNTSLLAEVCSDDDQNNDGSSTTKPSNSENKIIHFDNKSLPSQYHIVVWATYIDISSIYRE